MQAGAGSDKEMEMSEIIRLDKYLADMSIGTRQEVKKYIQDNHGADIPEVSEACDVDPAQIRQWIREDRLQFADDSPIMIPCEKCGKMIRSGRFCEQCKAEMTNTFRNAFTPYTKPVNQKTEGLRSERDRMRYL